MLPDGPDCTAGDASARIMAMGLGSEMGFESKLGFGLQPGPAAGEAVRGGALAATGEGSTRSAQASASSAKSGSGVSPGVRCGAVRAKPAKKGVLAKPCGHVRVTHHWLNQAQFGS